MNDIFHNNLTWYKILVLLGSSELVKNSEKSFYFVGLRDF